MKKLSSLLLGALLFCGLAIAQTYGHPDQSNDHPNQATDQTNDHHAMSMDAQHPPAERITHGPVVESTGPSWATIAWSTDTGGSSVVRYGRDRDHLTQMAESPYVDSKSGAGQTHRVKIDHLEPGTTYYYMVDSGQGQGTGTQARSNVEQFTTKR